VALARWTTAFNGNPHLPGSLTILEAPMTFCGLGAVRRRVPAMVGVSLL
jgi:hypothetical protein